MGFVFSKKTATITGIVLLIIFLLLCGVIFKEKYTSETFNSSESSTFFEGTDESNTELTNAGEASPKPTATPEPTSTLSVEDY